MKGIGLGLLLMLGLGLCLTGIGAIFGFPFALSMMLLLSGAVGSLETAKILIMVIGALCILTGTSIAARIFFKDQINQACCFCRPDIEDTVHNPYNTWLKSTVSSDTPIQAVTYQSKNLSYGRFLPQLTSSKTTTSELLSQGSSSCHSNICNP